MNLAKVNYYTNRKDHEKIYCISCFKNQSDSVSFRFLYNLACQLYIFKDLPSTVGVSLITQYALIIALHIAGFSCPSVWAVIEKLLERREGCAARTEKLSPTHRKLSCASYTLLLLYAYIITNRPLIHLVDLMQRQCITNTHTCFNFYDNINTNCGKCPY